METHDLEPQPYFFQFDWGFNYPTALEIVQRNEERWTKSLKILINVWPAPGHLEVTRS